MRGGQVCVPPELLTVVIDGEAHGVIVPEAVEWELVTQDDSDLEGSISDGFDVILACIWTWVVWVLVGIIVELERVSL